MPGRIILVAVAIGDLVGKGQALVAVEAMKMEHVMTAPFDGAVASLSVAVGDQVTEGQPMLLLHRSD